MFQVRRASSGGETHGFREPSQACDVDAVTLWAIAARERVQECDSLSPVRVFRRIGGNFDATRHVREVDVWITHVVVRESVVVRAEERAATLVDEVRSHGARDGGAVGGGGASTEFVERDERVSRSSAKHRTRFTEFNHKG